VVRRTFASYRPATGKWVDVYVVEGHDYSEVIPGVWAPARVTRLQGGASKEQKTVFDSLEVRNSNWVINGKLPDSTFELEFQPAMVIADEQTGKTYQTVEIRDDKIVQQVSEGMEIYHKKSSLSWKKIALWTIVGLVSLTVSLLALLRVRRSRRALNS
jgi:hypothetical protein